MKRKCDNDQNIHIEPISDQDFKAQYPQEKLVVRVDIGKNSCGICS